MVTDDGEGDSPWAPRVGNDFLAAGTLRLMFSSASRRSA